MYLKFLEFWREIKYIFLKFSYYLSIGWVLFLPFWQKKKKLFYAVWSICVWIRTLVTLSSNLSNIDKKKTQTEISNFEKIVKIFKQ